MSNPYDGPILIKETFKLIHKHNPISGHRWTEHGKTTGWDVTGGGWMRSTHKTLKDAEKEAATRKKILEERIARGECHENKLLP